VPFKWVTLFWLQQLTLLLIPQAFRFIMSVCQKHNNKGESDGQEEKTTAIVFGPSSLWSAAGERVRDRWHSPGENLAG
jgi:hypothetical protein